jgi:Protein of unknown function (DUF742)
MKDHEDPPRPPRHRDPRYSARTADVPDIDDPRLRLRPFVLTAGQVRGAEESIAPETQIVSTDYGYANWGTLHFERRDIVSLCAVPQSVAEICARLSLHLGVVRTLVGDLAADGYLSIHIPDEESTHSVDTIMRVLNGLRAI